MHDIVWECLGVQLDLADLYSGPRQGQYIYELHGFTGSYDEHAVLFKKCPNNREKWFIVNDEAAQVVGNWGAVVENCSWWKITPEQLFFGKV
jgi:hypothetical protein